GPRSSATVAAEEGRRAHSAPSATLAAKAPRETQGAESRYSNASRNATIAPPEVATSTRTTRSRRGRPAPLLGTVARSAARARAAMAKKTQNRPRHPNRSEERRVGKEGKPRRTR